MKNTTSTDKRFRGQARLLTLHLWRIAKSTNIEECLAQARKLGMIDSDNETFIRKCLDAMDRIEAGEDPGMEITAELVDELQACVLRLNSADPA